MSQSNDQTKSTKNHHQGHHHQGHYHQGHHHQGHQQGHQHQQKNYKQEFMTLEFTGLPDNIRGLTIGKRGYISKLYTGRIGKSLGFRLWRYTVEDDKINGGCKIVVRGQPKDVLLSQSYIMSHIFHCLSIVTGIKYQPGINYSFYPDIESPMTFRLYIQNDIQKLLGEYKKPKPLKSRKELESEVEKLREIVNGVYKDNPVQFRPVSPTTPPPPEARRWSSNPEPTTNPPPEEHRCSITPEPTMKPTMELLMNTDWSKETSD